MKKLILTAVTLAVSSSLFALHGEGFKIISETHKVTGAVAGWIEKENNVSPYANGAHAGAQTYDYKGHVKQNINIQANHFYNIRNETGRSQRYKVHYDVHCLRAAGVHDIELELRPGGWIDEVAKNFITVQPEQKGQFEIHASTDIYGESQAKASDGKTLKVN